MSASVREDVSKVEFLMYGDATTGEDKDFTFRFGSLYFGGYEEDCECKEDPEGNEYTEVPVRPLQSAHTLKQTERWEGRARTSAYAPHNTDPQYNYPRECTTRPLQLRSTLIPPPTQHKFGT